jgi:RNA polymerase sigma-54 factor
MAYGLGQTHRLETNLSLRVDPRLVVASQLLQLGTTQLEAAIDSELNENPALDRLEAAEPVTHNEVLGVVAPNELRPWSDSWESCRSLPQDFTDNWVELAADHNSITDHVMVDLKGRLPKHLHELAEYVVGSLDDRGYLTSAEEDIAIEFGADFDDVLTVIGRLHQCEPIGVGARTVPECLLLQLSGTQSVVRIARRIVREHLDDLTGRKTLKIAKKLGVEAELVERAIQLISRLNPYPLAGHSHRHTMLGPAKSGVTPDLVIRRTEQGWQVEATGADPSGLRIDPFYQRRMKELAGAPKSRCQAELRHLTIFVQRANDFIDGLRNRRETLERIGAALIQRQTGFLSTGDYAFLRPLTRSELAKQLGLHESTVSRATNGKFVQVPDGETLSFDVFFRPALRVQKMIEEILSSENPSNPLSDEQISKMLSSRGVKVARRTVNKYRDRKKLLSSRKRRVA